MLRKVFCTLLFLSTCLYASAQISYSLGNDATYIARLENEARQAATDSIRAYNYLKLSLLCKRINDTSKAQDYLQRGVRLGARYPFVKASTAYYVALMQFGKTELATLEKQLLRADSLLKPFGFAEADKLRGIIWHNYGIVQQVKGDEKGAMEAFTNKAAPYAQRSGDGLVLGKAYKGIAIVFMNANQRAKAASYLEQAIQSIEKAPADNPLRTVELVETYIIAGENYVHQDQYEPAKRLLDKAKLFLAPYPASNLYLIYYFAEGLYFDKRQQYAQALQSLNKGMEVSTRFKAVYSLNRLKYAKYKTLSHQKDYANALLALKDLAQSPLVFTTDKKIYYKELYLTYATLGNTPEAFHWAKRYISLSDSLYENKYQNDIVELETKYKNAENQKKINALEAEKERSLLQVRNNRLLNWLLGTVSLFLLITAVFATVLYRNSRKLAQQKELNYQQQLKESEQKQQIQLAKALRQGEEQERKRLASDLHDGLGGMLAGIKIHLSRLATDTSANTNPAELHKIIDQLDVSATELRRIARNLLPESLLQLGLETALKDMCESLTTDTTHIRFQAICIGENLTAETQLTIYRIVQELLTNAIRHAHASEILVQCSQNENMFFITLEDNGRGFDMSVLPAKNGIGLTNVKSRVDYLKGKVDVSSLPDEGTTINIELHVNT